MVSSKTYRLIAIMDLQQDAGLTHSLVLMLYAQQPTNVQPLGYVRISHLQLALALSDIIYPCPRRGPRSRLSARRVLRFLGLKDIKVRTVGNMVYTMTAKFSHPAHYYRSLFNL